MHVHVQGNTKLCKSVIANMLEISQLQYAVPQSVQEVNLHLQDSFHKLKCLFKCVLAILCVYNA